MRHQTASLLLLAALLLPSCVRPPAREAAPLPRQVAALNLSRGVAAHESGDYAGAQHLFQEALAVYRALDLVEGELKATVNLIETALALGQLDLATARLARARELVRLEDEKQWSPRLDLLASSLALRQGDYERAEALLAPHLTEPRKGEEAVVIAALENMVLIAQAQNPAAVPERVRALAAFLDRRPEPPPAALARLYRFQAGLAQEQGRSEARDALYGQALEIYRSLTARPGLAASLEAWGRDLLADGDLAVANNRLERALAIRISMGDAAAAREILATLIEVDGEMGALTRQRFTAKWLEEHNGPVGPAWSDLLRQRLLLERPDGGR